MDPYRTPYGGVAHNSHPCLLVKSPIEYWHIRLIKVVLRILGAWPGEDLGEKVFFFEGIYYTYYITSLSIVFFIMQGLYLIENFSSLTHFDLGHICIAILMNIMSTSRCFCLSLYPEYRPFAVKFLTFMHLFYHKDKSDYSRKVYVKMHKMCNFLSLYMGLIMVAALIVFNIIPIIVNFRNDMFNEFNDPVNTTYELAVYFRLPIIDPEKSFNAFIFSFFLNWYASYLCASSVIIFNLFLSIMILNVWGHFKILLHDLDMFPKPAALMSHGETMTSIMKHAIIFSDSEQKEICIKLKENIIYHRLIIDFTNEMSKCFGMVLFVYYTFHQVGGCLMLLECSQGNSDALALYVPMTVMMFSELIQISIIFETICSMSEKVRDEVYCLPWEYMNTANRKTVMLFLINVQEPVHLKAGGLVDVGVTTMAGILKASFSYFAFLRTMSD